MTKKQSKKDKTDLDIVVEFNAFEDYFNSVWIGTPECGGRVPSSRDADYDEYIRLRIIALGAWMHRARYTPPGYLMTDNCTNVQYSELRELSKRIAEVNEAKISISKNAAVAIDKLIEENIILRAFLMASHKNHEEAVRSIHKTSNLENMDE